VDYDLYFSDPTRSSASLVVPFFLGAKSSLTIAMWVRFTQKDEGGIFFSLYSVSYVANLVCTLVFSRAGLHKMSLEGFHKKSWNTEI